MRMGDISLFLGGLTTPILFACSMKTFISLWPESYFKWLCTVSHFLSFHVTSGMSLACHDLSLKSHHFLQRFKLSPKRSLMSSILFFYFIFPTIFLSYIPIVDFSKPTWLLATFFTYPFYHSTHQTQICWPATWFNHVILFDQQFDIS